MFQYFSDMLGHLLVEKFARPFSFYFVNIVDNLSVYIGNVSHELFDIRFSVEWGRKFEINFTVI